MAEQENLRVKGGFEVRTLVAITMVALMAEVRTLVAITMVALMATSPAFTRKASHHHP